MQEVTHIFDKAGIEVKQAKGDADWLIVSTALNIANASRWPVGVVATDTDILCMLVALSTDDMQITMLNPRPPQKSYVIPNIHLLELYDGEDCASLDEYYVYKRTLTNL